MICTVDTLEKFVAESDALGGPGNPACEQFWLGFEYRPTYPVNQDLDPFSEDYVQEQFALYEEITGHPYRVLSDEQTALDVDAHVRAANPYNHPDPALLAMHMQRLSRGLRYGKARLGETLLDLGCGWGLSSELAAYVGLKVKAIDVNADFVRLVNQRAAAGGRAISAENATFEEFTIEGKADLAMFYECFHHAVRPWAVLERVVANLNDSGRVILVGEPVNSIWWKNWGLRLDALSVYCIRKFGWFESGWSMPFLLEMLRRSSLIPTVYSDSDPVIGDAIIGTKAHVGKAIAGDVARLLFEGGDAQLLADNGYLIISGSGSTTLRWLGGSTRARLEIVNFRPTPVRTQLKKDDVTLLKGKLAPGTHYIDIEVTKGSTKSVLNFNVETWVPHNEIGNGDKRTLGIHLKSITF